MTKKLLFHLQKTDLWLILMLYVLGTGVCISDEAAGLALQEARVARETAERRSIQLEMELERAKAELSKTRTRYADLYLRSHDLIRSLRQTELQVANLWHNKDDSSFEGLTVRLLETLEAVGTRQLDVVKALDDYEITLQTILDVLQPSDTMRKELTDKLDKIKKAVRHSLSPVVAANKREQNLPVRKGCRVVAVDEGLQIVLLESGSLAGMTPESHWALLRDGKALATFTVIDVRLELSAAVLTDGSLSDVPVGSILQLVVHTR